MIYPNGMPAAYVGWKGTVDYSRVTQAVEDSTSIMIATIVGVILLGFGGFVVYAKRTIANAHMYDELPQSIMPGSKEKGKKEGKKEGKGGKGGKMGKKRGKGKGVKRAGGGGGDDSNDGNDDDDDDDNGKTKRSKWSISGW